MVWKKFAVLLLAASIALSMGACGGGDTDGSRSAEVFDTVGICVRRQSDDPAYYEALVSGLKTSGYGVVLEDSQNDQSKQNEQVGYLIAQNCEILVVEPVMVTALEEVISQAREAGVPLVLLDREPEAAVLDSYEKISYVGCESARAGTAQAQLMEQLSVRGDLNGDGIVSYMMLRGPEDHLDAQLITDACNLALEQMGTELLCTASTQWNLEDARAACAQALSEYGRDIEVIFCNDAQLALGAAEAVKNGGWTPGQDVYLVAVGSSEQLEILIRQGTVSATVAADDQQRVDKLVGIVQAMLAEQTVEKCNYVDYTAITVDSLKSDAA